MRVWYDCHETIFVSESTGRQTLINTHIGWLIVLSMNKAPNLISIGLFSSVETYRVQYWKSSSGNTSFRRTCPLFSDAFCKKLPNQYCNIAFFQNIVKQLHSSSEPELQ